LAIYLGNVPVKKMPRQQWAGTVREENERRALKSLHLLAGLGEKENPAKKRSYKTVEISLIQINRQRPVAKFEIGRFGFKKTAPVRARFVQLSGGYSASPEGREPRLAHSGT
jgi:hypothetical protein